MVEKKVIVTLENGLESRQAARLVQEAVCYTSRIYIVMEDIQVNAKCIMGVVSQWRPCSGRIPCKRRPRTRHAEALYRRGRVRTFIQDP